MTSSEYFKEIGWEDQADRDFYYVLNPETAQDMFSAAAIFANIMAEEFEGVSILPRGTSGVLRLRSTVMSNLDFIENNHSQDLKQILLKSVDTSFIPAGKDMIIEITFPNLYYKRPVSDEE